MKKTLKNLAKVTSGYSFRGAAPLKSDGDVLLIQAMDINEDGTIHTEHSKRISESEIPATAILAPKDILIVSRSAGLGGFRSGVFNNTSSKAIASATTQVIRIISNEITPEYLSAYLNSSQGQTEISRIATGSSVKMLSLSDLSDLIIPVPEIEKQKVFTELTQNINRQRDLLQQKTTLLNQVIKSTTTSITK